MQNGSDLSYKDLIMLKGLFNMELHNSIMRKERVKITEIMGNKYAYDMKLHNIYATEINCEELKSEYEKEIDIIKHNPSVLKNLL